MLLAYFQICYIFVFCVNIGKLCLSQENTTLKLENLQSVDPGECKYAVCLPTERGKCKKVQCRCEDFTTEKWEDIKCKDDYGFYFPTLLFQNIKYLSGKMFEGYRFRKFDLTIMDYYNVTIAENALDGILELEQFEVKRSSIKVIYLFILNVLEHSLGIAKILFLFLFF